MRLQTKTYFVIRYSDLLEPDSQSVPRLASTQLTDKMALRHCDRPPYRRPLLLTNYQQLAEHKTVQRSQS
mgnify:CR=1 FL=1